MRKQPKRRAPQPPPDETQLLPLAALAKLLPCVRGNKPPNRSTLYRWSTRGLQTRSGHRARLQARFVGGTLCASLADAQRFFDSIDDVEWVPPKHPRSVAEEAALEKQGREAVEALIASGFIKERYPGELLEPLKKGRGTE